MGKPNEAKRLKYFYIVIILLVLTIPCFGQTARTFTICESGGGCDYTTLQAAETDTQTDLTVADSIFTFEIQNTWVSADGNTGMAGWTSDATRFLTITAVGDARAAGEWSTSAYRISSASGTPLNVNGMDFMVLDGVQLETTHSSTSTIRIYNMVSFPIDVIIKNCFFRGNGGTNTTGVDFNNGDFGNNMVCRNTVIIDCGLLGINVNVAAGGVKLDNNTIENCLTGISTAPNDAIARNNILWNNTTQLSGDFNTTTLSQENFTDAGSLSYGGCGSCGTGDQVSQSDPFVAIGSQNYNLASGATAIDAGLDLSGDFTDAIGGKTRDANFDKGADEFIAAGLDKVLIRVGMIFWRYGIMI